MSLSSTSGRVRRIRSSASAAPSASSTTAPQPSSTARSRPRASRSLSTTSTRTPSSDGVASRRPPIVSRATVIDLLRIHRRERHPDEEGGALAVAGAERFHRAAVQLDQVAHDREPEPQAAVHTRGGGILLAEAVEDVGEEGRVDPRAGVGHVDGHAAVLPRQRDADAPAFGRELDRVGQQVPDDLLQPPRVAEDRLGVRRQVRVDADAPGIGRRPDGFERGVDDAPHGRRPACRAAACR